MKTQALQFAISPGELILIDGLQRDRRKRNEVRITLPDGRVLEAEGRRPEEEGWFVAFEDGSDAVGGLNLADSIGVLLGWKIGLTERPDWLERFEEAVAPRTA